MKRLRRNIYRAQLHHYEQANRMTLELRENKLISSTVCPFELEPTNCNY